MKHSKHDGNVVQVPGKATVNGTAFAIGIGLNELATLSQYTLKGPQNLFFKNQVYDISMQL